jgi:hypothetical protein
VSVSVPVGKERYGVAELCSTLGAERVRGGSEQTFQFPTKCEVYGLRKNKHSHLITYPLPHSIEELPLMLAPAGTDTGTHTPERLRNLAVLRNKWPAAIPPRERLRPGSAAGKAFTKPNSARERS